MVLTDEVEPQIVGDVALLQQRLTDAWVLSNGLLLRAVQGFALHGEFVLQQRHADVHGQRGPHQGIAFVFRQAEFARHDVAKRATDQRMRSAVAHGGRRGELEHEVERRIDVTGHQVLQPAIELAQLRAEVVHVQRAGEQDRQTRFQVSPEAQQVLVFLIVRVARQRGECHGFS